MSGMQVLFMNYGQTLSTVDSADFDGANDFMLRGAGLTGAADSKSGILACWVRIDAGDGVAARYMESTDLRFLFVKNNTNTLAVGCKNSAGTEILLLRTAATFTAGATWIHFLASWDLATAAGHLYINDVSDAGTTTLTDGTIDYTVANWGIGSIGLAAPSADGCLAELYFASGQYLDFSIVANRRRFISANGKPVWLGTDGAIPTGTAPIIYQRVADGAAVATFATNLGTGGDFSITGTLATGSTSPSD